MQKTFNFGKAIELLKSGKKVARKGWNGKDMYLTMVVATCDYAVDSNIEFADIAVPCIKSEYPSYIPTDPYIVMRTAQKTAQPGWLASQADMLAEDWVIVK